MSPSRFLSSTSAAWLAATAATAAGCGGDSHGPADAPIDATSCGPGDAPAAGLVASAGAATLTYGHLTGGLNNDCPASDAPAGVVSLTIAGSQTDGTGVITLCVARPDLLAGHAQALGPDDATAAVRVVDVTGTAGGCSFTVDRTQPPSGTATATGLCSNGRDAAGFALVLDGQLSLTRTCGATVDSIAITLHGRVAVASG